MNEANALYSTERRFLTFGRTLPQEICLGTSPKTPIFTPITCGRTYCTLGKCLGHHEAYRSILAANEMLPLHGLSLMKSKFLERCPG